MSIHQNNMNLATQIHQSIRARIINFLPFGFNKLWFQVSGDCLEPLATCLGYWLDDFIDMIDFRGLSKFYLGTRYLKVNDWLTKLKFVMKEHTKQTKVIDTQTKTVILAQFL
jgi:FlaG/FlaF family flagellin (archaellin)